MKVSIRPRNLSLSPAHHEQILRRVRLAFERLTSAITSVDLFIADVNGPKGGPDKQCRLRVRGKGIGTVLIEHVGEDTLTTVSYAAARAERALVRVLSRSRAFDRRAAA